MAQEFGGAGGPAGHNYAEPDRLAEAAMDHLAGAVDTLNTSVVKLTERIISLETIQRREAAVATGQSGGAPPPARDGCRGRTSPASQTSSPTNRLRSSF